MPFIVGDIYYRISPHPSYIFYRYQKGNGGDTDVKRKDIEDSGTGTVGDTFSGKSHRKDGQTAEIGRKNKT